MSQFNFEEIVIVEQVVGQSNVSTYNLKTRYTNHVDQLVDFNIPQEIYDDALKNGSAQFLTDNRHGDSIVLTLIVSVS